MPMGQRTLSFHALPLRKLHMPAPNRPQRVIAVFHAADDEAFPQVILAHAGRSVGEFHQQHLVIRDAVMAATAKDGSGRCGEMDAVYHRLTCPR